MKINIQKEQLSRALLVTQSIVERKTTMPILANVLISASDGELKISATDLEITAVSRSQAGIQSSGSTTVNARVFSEIVRELPEGEVTMELTENERLEICAGNSKFRMVGVSAEEYPSLPGLGVATEAKIGADQFLDMIQKTLYAVSHDETRFNLNGVSFEIGSEEGKKGSMLRMVATDGHRLALIHREVESLSFEGCVIVPTKGLSELKKVLDNSGSSETGIAIHDGFLVVETGDTKISMRLIDGEFPDYQQVMPKQEGVEVKVENTSFVQALRRAALMVTDKGKCVKLDFAPGNLRISSSSPELGDSTEEMPIEYEGEPVSVGFNAKYLLDFSNSVGEAQWIQLELSGELGPAKLLLQGDASYFGIVMPMRLT